MASRKSNQRFIAWSIVAIILLLATNAYQWWNNMQITEELELHQQELAAVELMQGQLEKDYELALSSLEELKGDNSELNAMIDAQKLELKAQKDKISGLIWKSKKLDEAKLEIENLKNTALNYVEEINKLKAEKESLLVENTQLRTQTVNLSSAIDYINVEKDSINKEKDSIFQLKEKLSQENKTLSVKATKASVIEVLELDVTGYSIRDNGSLKKKRKASSISLLQFCFKLVPNELSDNDVERFYLKIVNPAGETIYKEQLGAGIFIKAADSTKNRYTFTAELNMPMATEEVCINYEPKETLSKGLYLVELYNKGYLSGSGSFTLK